jgi:hypothetical protein
MFAIYVTKAQICKKFQSHDMIKWLICHVLTYCRLYHWINVKYDLYKLDLNFIAMFHMILNTMYKITTNVTIALF